MIELIDFIEPVLCAERFFTESEFIRPCGHSCVSPVAQCIHAALHSLLPVIHSANQLQLHSINSFTRQLRHELHFICWDIITIWIGIKELILGWKRRDAKLLSKLSLTR